MTVAFGVAVATEGPAEEEAALAAAAGFGLLRGDCSSSSSCSRLRRSVGGTRIGENGPFDGGVKLFEGTGIRGSPRGLIVGRGGGFQTGSGGVKTFDI